MSLWTIVCPVRNVHLRLCIRPLSCSVSVSTASIRNISARSEKTEFITAAMFKTFRDSLNKQMDTIQHSLDSLNSTYYDEYEDYEDEEGDNYDSEDEPPRKYLGQTFFYMLLRAWF